MQKIVLTLCVTLTLFLTINDSRSGLFDKIIKEVDSAVDELDKAVKDNREDKIESNTSKKSNVVKESNTSKKTGSAQDFVDHISNYYGINQYWKRCNASGGLSDQLYNGFKSDMKKIVKYHQEDNGISDTDIKKYKQQANQKGIAQHQETIAIMEMGLGFGQSRNTITDTQYINIRQFCQEQWPGQNMIIKAEIKNINNQSNAKTEEEIDF
jgi:hypothetical protein